jgi:hypothetical protein
MMDSSKPGRTSLNGLTGWTAPPEKFCFRSRIPNSLVRMRSPSRTRKRTELKSRRCEMAADIINKEFNCVKQCWLCTWNRYLVTYTPWVTQRGSKTSVRMVSASENVRVLLARLGTRRPKQNTLTGQQILPLFWLHFSFSGHQHFSVGEGHWFRSIST